MDFSSYVKGLPNTRQETIESIAKATMSSKSCVYHWMANRYAVPPLKRRIISGLLGIAEEELFPND